MSRKALAWVVAAPVAAAVIALMLDGPDRQAVQPIGRAQGDASVEIELHDPWVNDAVTRAWAVDPVTTVGNAIAHNDEQRRRCFSKSAATTRSSSTPSSRRAASPRRSALAVGMTALQST